MDEPLEQDELQTRENERQVLTLVFGLLLFLGMGTLPVALMKFGKPDFWSVLAFSGAMFGVGAAGLYVQKRSDWKKSIFAGLRGRITAVVLIGIGIGILVGGLLGQQAAYSNVSGVLAIVYGLRELRKNLSGRYDES